MQPSRKDPEFTWFVKYVGSLLLIPQIILLVYLREQLVRPVLALYAGLMFMAFLVWFAYKKPRKTRLARAGCLLFLMALLISLFLGLASCMAYLTGIGWEGLAEQSLTLFLLVFTFWPIIVFWGSAEALYYQAHLAPQIERDLGFQHGTSYIDGPFTGEKYFFLSWIQTGGRMDLAGFRLSDIVLDVDKVGFTGFWQRLEEARGSAPVPITVASWSDPGLVANRPTRRLIVSVPPKNFSTALEAALGFRGDVEYFKENGSWVGVVVVRNLVPDGLMAKAGFQDRDILLDVGGVPDLFERLEQARGREPITLEAVPWLEPTDIADRPVRELILEIPPMAKNRPKSYLTYWQVDERDLERDLGFRLRWE